MGIRDNERDTDDNDCTMGQDDLLDEEEDNSEPRPRSRSRYSKSTNEKDMDDNNDDDYDENVKIAKLIDTPLPRKRTRKSAPKIPPPKIKATSSKTSIPKPRSVKTRSTPSKRKMESVVVSKNTKQYIPATDPDQSVFLKNYRIPKKQRENKKRSRKDESITSDDQQDPHVPDLRGTVLPAIPDDKFANDPVCDGMKGWEEYAADADTCLKLWSDSKGRLCYIAAPISSAPLFSTIVTTTYTEQYKPSKYSRWIEDLNHGIADTRYQYSALPARDRGPPGSVVFTPATTSNDFDVITILSRLREGPPDTYEDSATIRQKWFCQGLREIKATYGSHHILSVPYAIGTHEGIMGRKERQEIWRPFHQTLADFVMMNTDKFVMVFMGTPEGGTDELQQMISHKPPNLMITETIGEDIKAVDQVVRSDGKLTHEQTKKGAMRNMLKERISLRVENLKEHRAARG